MFANTWTGKSVTLRKGELWPITSDLRGLAIESREGILWVTQKDDPEDYILEPGQRFVVTRRGTLVVQAISDARLRVAPPLETAPDHSYRVTVSRP
jgi:hypothetical protein